MRDLTDDLIVVDSGSTDGTQEVCERLGARVIYNPWPGYGMQKRFGEEQCRHDWMLNIDADEVVPPNLAGEIRALFANGEPPNDAYKLRIGELFPGEANVHRWAYTLRRSASTSAAWAATRLQPCMIGWFGSRAQGSAR